MFSGYHCQFFGLKPVAEGEVHVLDLDMPGEAPARCTPTEQWVERGAVEDSPRQVCHRDCFLRLRSSP